MVSLVGLAAMAMFLPPAETQVSFKGVGDMELFGTLTMPATGTAKIFPAALLIPGSGPTDRDGNQPGLTVNILKQIAASLAENGIASLRYDKRACAKYHAKWPQDVHAMAEFFDYAHFIGDATAAFRCLQGQPHIYGKRVALIGHSEGALYALQVCSDLARDPMRPAALVSLDGDGRNFGTIIKEQIEYRLTAAHNPAAVKKMYMDALERAIQQVTKDGTAPDDLPPGLDALFNASSLKLLQSYFTIDPTTLARNYPGPVLLVNGADDRQISPERDLPALLTACQSRSTGTVEKLIVPHASHNLKSTVGGNYDNFQGPVEPVVLTKIDQFLAKSLGNQP